MSEQQLCTDFLKTSFSIRQFKIFLVSATLNQMVFVIMKICDSIIAGHLFGESAIGAVNLVNPILFMCLSSSMMVSLGTSILYSYEQGKFNHQKATDYFSLGILMAIGVGIGISVFASIIEGTYYNFYGITEQMRYNASQYFIWIKAGMIFYPLTIFLFYMVYSDGDMAISNLATIIYISVNIFCSLFASKHFGIMGIGFGTFCAIISSLSVLCFHFKRKFNSLRFKLHFSIRDIMQIYTMGRVESSRNFLTGVTTFIINKFIISKFGEEYLVVYAFILAITNIKFFYNGISTAMKPILSIFRGESNNKGTKDLIKTAVEASIIEGIVLTALVIIIAPMLMSLYGITSEEIRQECMLAIKIISPTFLFISLVYLFSNYCIIMGKVYMATVFGFLNDFAILLLGIFLISNFTGIESIWISYMISPVITIGLCALLIYIFYGKKCFPYLIDLSNSNIENINFIISEKNVMSARNKAEVIMNSKNIDKKIQYQVMLLIEEAFLYIHDKNPGRKIRGEITFLFEKNLKVIFRDNGKFLNLEEENSEISSLRSFVLASMMEHHSEKSNLVTISYNRNIFIFNSDNNR